MMGSTDEQIQAAVKTMNQELDWVMSLSENQKPAHQVCFEEPFWIDQLEVTNAQFRRFDGQAKEPSEWDGDLRPREKISQKEAADFCEKRGARLPTEAEWEYAARGPDNLIFPWGNDFEVSYAVYDDNSARHPWDVGERPEGASWVGALDMAGNVEEWTSSADMPYPYDQAHEGDVEDGLFTGAGGIIRGGGWYSDDYNLMVAYRNRLDLPELADAVGFRCARSTTDPQADIAAAAAAPTPSITGTPNPPIYGPVMLSPTVLPSSYNGPLPDNVVKQIGLGDLLATRVSPSGKYIALGASAAVIVYRTDTLEIVWSSPHSETSRLAWAQDDTRLATSSDSDVTVWDNPSGQKLFSTTSVLYSYPKIAFTPDNRHLVSAANNGDVIIWDAETGNKLRLFKFTETPPDPEYPEIRNTVFDVSPDGKLLALSYVYSAPWDCCFLGHTVMVWDISTGTQRLKIEEPEQDQGGGMAGVYDLAWSPDSKILAVYNSNSWTSPSNTEFWDLSTREKAGTVDTPGYNEWLSWSPDGKRVAAYQDGNSTVIDTTTYEILFQFEFNDRENQFLGWSGDSSQLAIHNKSDDSLTFLDSRSGEKQSGPRSVSGSNSFTPDFAHFFFLGGLSTGAFQNKPYKALVQWSADAGKVDHVLAIGSGDYVRDSSWSPDGSQVAVSIETDHRQVLIWDVKANKAVASLDSGVGSWITSWSPNGEVFANVLDNVIDLYDATTWASLGSISIGTSMGRAIRSISWSPDSERIAIQTYPQQLRVMEIPSGDIVYEKTTADPYGIVSWSTDGKQIATVGEGGDIELWDASTGELQTSVKLTPNIIDGSWVLSFSPDLSMLAGASSARSGAEPVTIVWSAASGQALHTFSDAANCGCSLVWTPWLPDGSGIALQPGTSVGIFDPQTGDILQTLPALPDRFSPDGTLYTTNYSRAVMLWEVPR